MCNTVLTPDKKSAIVLGQELGIGEIAVHELGGFWVSKGVLKRTGEQYEVLETVDKQRNTEGDAVMLQSVQTSEERSAEEMKVYWQYIVGMLTNLGCLPTERIHSFLKMLVPRETPYTKSSNELEQFLLLMVDEGNLEATSAGYKLLKQS
jgi:anaphase-promoting complex subunit 2